MHRFIIERRSYHTIGLRQRWATAVLCAPSTRNFRSEIRAEWNVSYVLITGIAVKVCVSERERELVSERENSRTRKRDTVVVVYSDA